MNRMDAPRGFLNVRSNAPHTSRVKPTAGLIAGLPSPRSRTCYVSVIDPSRFTIGQGEHLQCPRVSHDEALTSLDSVMVAD